VRQIGRLVDVVQRRQLFPAQAGGGQALARGRHHGRRAPRHHDIVEQEGRGADQAHQDIAAVEGGHEDSIVRIERSRGFAQPRGD
jgi:hypothetical protein